jgi:hypothetical protein
MTALALAGGASVILIDPLFHGMAVSLLFGVLVSTILTLLVIQLGCVSAGAYLKDIASADAPCSRHREGAGISLSPWDIGYSATASDHNILSKDRNE